MRVGSASEVGLAQSYGSLRTIGALMLREMSTRYGRSVGGYVWAVVEPISAIFLLALGFSLLILAPSLGTSFILFYATGYLPFYIYQQVSTTTSRSLNFSRPLLFYPTVTWLDALLARFALNGLTTVMVSAVTLILIMATLETRVALDAGPLLLATVLALGLGLGVGTLNCALVGLFPTWDMIWGIITRPLFLASGVLYVHEDLPRLVQDILWFNPLLHIAGLVREGIYATYRPDYTSVAFVLGISLTLLALGLLLLRRYHRDILESG